MNFYSLDVYRFNSIINCIRIMSKSTWIYNDSIVLFKITFMDSINDISFMIRLEKCYFVIKFGEALPDDITWDRHATATIRIDD